MSLISNGKVVLKELKPAWRQIAAIEGLPVEFSYRFDKLGQRLDAIGDKIFIKTIKAHNILSECAQLTGQFMSELDISHEVALRLLTRIESRMDLLEKDTYEFRVKAG
jgi:hypothetical protein